MSTSTPRALTQLRRHLHIVALMLNDKEKWNAELLSKFFPVGTASDSGVESKTFRLDLQKNIEKMLGIPMTTKKGCRHAEISEMPDNDQIVELLKLYTNFVVQDTSRTIMFNRLIEQQGTLCMWNLARIHFAILKKHKISFTYETNEMKIRSVIMKPYHIVSRDKTIYLLGSSVNLNDASSPEMVKMYIFDRIKDLKMEEDKKFEEEIPSLEGNFKHSHGLFKWQWSPPVKVTIRYPMRRKNNMRDEFWHLNAETKEFKDHVDMSFLVHDYESVCRQLFFYGGDVEIVSPPEVRDYMIGMLEESMSVYKK